MGMCEICGRRWGTLSHECGRHEASRTHGATACYRIGFEREKARADDLAAKLAELPAWIKTSYERELFRGSVSDFCTDLAHSLAERLKEPTQ